MVVERVADIPQQLVRVVILKLRRAKRLRGRIPGLPLRDQRNTRGLLRQSEGVVDDLHHRVHDIRNVIGLEGLVDVVRRTFRRLVPEFVRRQEPLPVDRLNGPLVDHNLRPARDTGVIQHGPGGRVDHPLGHLDLLRDADSSPVPRPAHPRDRVIDSLAGVQRLQDDLNRPPVDHRHHGIDKLLIRRDGFRRLRIASLKRRAGNPPHEVPDFKLLLVLCFVWRTRIDARLIRALFEHLLNLPVDIPGEALEFPHLLGRQTIPLKDMIRVMKILPTRRIGVDKPRVHPPARRDDLLLDDQPNGPVLLLLDGHGPSLLREGAL